MGNIYSEQYDEMKNVYDSYEYQGLRIKNRIVRAATNDYSGGYSGEITEIQFNLYRTLAKNDIGLIITGNFYVSEDGRLDITQNAADKNFDEPGVRLLVKTVHEFGAKIVVQISHAGRKTKINDRAARFYEDAGQIPEDKIREIIRDFTDAARRCIAASADGIELHFGHGYLLGELLTERRDGLSLAEQILSSIRSEFPMYPVLVKVDSDIDAGILGTFCFLCRKYRVWAVELSGSDFYLKNRDEHNYYEAAVRKIKNTCRVPIIMTGGVRSFKDANEALMTGAECVGMSRPFISEPDLIKKWPEKQSRCISCSSCFSLYRKTGRRCILEQHI